MTSFFCDNMGMRVVGKRSVENPGSMGFGKRGFSGREPMTDSMEVKKKVQAFRESFMGKVVLPSLSVWLVQKETNKETKSPRKFARELPNDPSKWSDEVFEGVVKGDMEVHFVGFESFGGHYKEHGLTKDNWWKVKELSEKSSTRLVSTVLVDANKSKTKSN